MVEFEIIARHFAPIAGQGAFGLLDDAAILAPRPGCDIVLTKDLLVEGVHFFADDPPAEIARKALRVNLSDLAAKGAKPSGFLLGFAYGPQQDEAWVEKFAQGMAADSQLFRCSLLGGDTVRSPVLMLSITVFGEVPSGRMVQRQAGATGDAIYVSGTIGDASLGLQARLYPQADWVKALVPAHRDFLLQRYLVPQPRLALAPVLLEFAQAAMDISDGLVGDCDKLAAGFDRSVQMDHIPLSSAARAAIARDPALLDVALTGGDDYEILALVSPDKCVPFENAALQSGVAVAKIGMLGKNPGELGKNRGEACWLNSIGEARSFVSRSYVHSQ